VKTQNHELQYLHFADGLVIDLGHFMIHVSYTSLVRK